MNATKTAKADAAIANADKVRRLTLDEVRALPGMLGRTAVALIAVHGFYAYTDAATGRKVCIVLR